MIMKDFDFSPSPLKVFEHTAAMLLVSDHPVGLITNFQEQIFLLRCVFGDYDFPPWCKPTYLYFSIEFLSMFGFCKLCS